MTIAPEADTSIPDVTSRRARLAERRRRRVRILFGVLVAVMVVAAAVFAVFAAQDEPNAATAVQSNPRINPSQTTIKNQSAATDTVRPLTHDAPLRLWVGGDSLAGSFGPALGDLVGATGVAKTTVDYKVSSGLWGSDFRDWPSRATEQMAAHNPEAVVFMIGTNDTPAVNMVDNDADGTPDWQVDYRAKINEMMKTFVGPNHRTVYWIGPPTLGTDSMDEGALALSDIMRREAEKFAPDVVFVDAYKLFSVESGEYSRVILDENGEEFTARIADGVHLSADGAEFLGRTLFSLLDAQWKLTKQADAAQPIGWSFADGSGENIPGYSSPPRRYQNSGGSNNGGGYTPEPSYTPVTDGFVPTTIYVAPTAPPATAPPATSPPATSPPATNPPATTPHT